MGIIKRPKNRIFILCNSELAEPYYFQDFREHLRVPKRIIIPKRKEFLRKAPWDFIDLAIKYKLQLAQDGKFSSEDGDQIWCVLDVDNYWDENEPKFKAAVNLAEENDLKIAWSNECFEFWFLCHFGFYKSALPRVDYHKKLEKYFKDKGFGDYKKNMKSIFNPLLPFQEEAIKHAKKLYKKDGISNNPSTSVHLLVGELVRNFG